MNYEELKFEKKGLKMMHTIPAKNKPLIDLTAFDQDDWREDIEREIERLNDMITRLMYGKNGGSDEA